MAKFPWYKQLDQMDCGPTCLRMVAKHYGKSYSLQYLREHSYISRTGVSVKGISEAAEHIGFRTLAVKLPFQSQEGPSFMDIPLPAIVHWEQKHFVVVHKIGKKRIEIADPAFGLRSLSYADFKKAWISDVDKGVALLLDPSPEFFQQEGQQLKRTNLTFLLKYLRPYRKLMFQLFIGLFFGSLFQLTFPFLTQAIVDVGIDNQDINFIYLVLIGQLMLFLGQLSVSVLQNWILLHIGTRVNVSLISDFLRKLMRLPIGFFDTKIIGDLLQRISDHHRIEKFLTGSTLNVLFSLTNFFVFGLVLIVYDTLIFLVFLFGSILYVAWILWFLKKRKEVDYAQFEERSKNQSALIELIEGMQEIKLQNSETKRRWNWANIQARLFRANIRSLSITQSQDAGARSINQVKDIIITFLAAQAVLSGSITLGMMLAIQYIVGQLNGPLNAMIDFIRTTQDAQISLERLGEIHEKEEEIGNDKTIDIIPESGDIEIENLSFRYNPLDDFVLQDFNLTIPRGKVTAIVGTSGSGKTTLVKLLLGFYEPSNGQIRLGGIQLGNINKALWRSRCGAVMQDGFIFADTVANNIAESEDEVDRTKLLKSVQLANIQRFIESMPLGYNTMLGYKGNGISQGQRQRILIARAVYKDPDFLFFDEATNALDANNERIIVENLEAFFEKRTVVVVAHRLSTVKNADQIVVIEKGKIVEQGNHDELVQKQGAYYHLVKNQLELGS